MIFEYISMLSLWLAGGSVAAVALFPLFCLLAIISVLVIIVSVAHSIREDIKNRYPIITIASVLFITVLMVGILSSAFESQKLHRQFHSCVQKIKPMTVKSNNIVSHIDAYALYCKFRDNINDEWGDYAFSGVSSVPYTTSLVESFD